MDEFDCLHHTFAKQILQAVFWFSPVTTGETPSSLNVFLSLETDEFAVSDLRPAAFAAHVGAV
ncbi:hypothetical protein [Massilia terrae]|uniref:Uncharacterized protein n=1 Tax=Massilia terrae TaxID=1811224 RepID=A0ABT2D6L3_9BURK|nr:hypothetical protein [Massilia terrae]MCS0661010.1 hypothetical protein [Massilia terrae]